MVTDKTKILEDKEYMSIISNLLRKQKVIDMRGVRQHFNVNCFDHCLYVSYNTYLICKKLKLDYKSAARAGMLHDLYLYDWRKRENGRKGHHAFTHPKEALKQALSIVELNDKEKDIIQNHMWPVTINLPKYKETYIITLVDKYFGVAEAFLKSDEIVVKEKERVV